MQLLESDRPSGKYVPSQQVTAQWPGEEDDPRQGIKATSCEWYEDVFHPSQH